VDATNATAVARLCQRKRRPHKPFALLVADLAPLEGQVRITPAERRELEGAAAPIVLLRRLLPPAISTPGRVVAAVAPGSPSLGVMLPASPLHLLLAAAVGRPLVATSGNPSGEPLCTEPAEALERLGAIADAFLVHNRPIARPLDDSVLQLIEERPVLLRRARGYAPAALDLPRPPAADRAALALGGDLKAAPALALAGRIWLAPHQGDLACARLQQRLASGVEALLQRHGTALEALVADAHPGYASGQLARQAARRHRLPLRAVQHHQAHGLAVAAEHGLADGLLVWAADGLGYGPGPGHRLWGGELLWLACGRMERLACLRPWPLPGGERAMAEPRRAALGLLAAAGWLQHHGAAASRRAFADPDRRLLEQALRASLNAPLTSSLGRLFDAAASLLDLVQVLSFEGQAGLLLEGLARRHGEATAAPAAGLLPLRPVDAEAPPLPLGWLDWQPLLQALLEGLVAGTAPTALAAWWHRSVEEGLAAAAACAARQRGCRQVALAGGCFQNALLLEGTAAALRREGLEPFWSEQVPCNDGGLALGQLWAELGNAPITNVSGIADPCAWPPPA
jgi:hydrogenase maturation protein HypF